MVELTPQGIGPSPFMEKVYPVNRNRLVVIPVGALAAPHPPPPPTPPRHGYPPDLQEGARGKCPPCLRTCVHHVSDLNSCAPPLAVIFRPLRVFMRQFIFLKAIV